MNDRLLTMKITGRSAFFGLLLTFTGYAGAEDFSGWRYYKVLNFNTTESGAGVTGDVHNYPVAVALDESNFNFSQAKADGADIRFSGKMDGEPLVFDIEHWDGSGRTALVWVKTGTVRGNSASQSIYMHWGSADAADGSDPAAVFDVEEGFTGVWHLGEEGSTDEGGYRDSTANAAHGTGVNLTPGSRADARLGKGLMLDYAKKQWVKVDGEKRKLFDITNRLTFSIWAKARSYSNPGSEERRALPGYETMFAKGDNSWRLQKFGIKSWHNPPAELIEICVEQDPRGDLCVVGTVDMTMDRWFHFTGVHDHPQAKVYVNGVLDKEETFDVVWKSGDHPVGIGNQSQFPEQGRHWDGVLDEARVMSVVKNDDWIKLEYESQREGQRFLTFGGPQERF